MNQNHKDSKKLNIRIQLPTEETEATEAIPVQTEIILWGRVVAASSAIVTVFIVTVIGAYWLLSNNEENPNIATTIIENPKPSTPSANIAKAIPQTKPGSQLKTKTTVNPATIPVSISTKKIHPAIQTPPTTPIASTVKTSSSKLSTTPTLSTIPNPSENPLIDSSLSNADSNPVEDLSSSPFQQTKSEIFSNHIKRFVISKRVKNNEPIGSISDIGFDHNNIATIYAYSDALNFKDQTLYYKWTLNGKKIATVPIGVWSNRWRSYSSKFIQPHMQGNWLVELQNAEGETLAMSQFQF
ncbi:MAG: DUF2914 domain-containing protein [Pseudomonadales bacterium]|nr:DUF2914 domain-containing protein [Pseudomonadales bacterium]